MNCYFNLFYSLLDLRSSECDVVLLYVVCCSVNVSVCFVCCVFVNCLVVKQFAMCLGVVAILLLNVMDVFSVCGSEQHINTNLTIIHTTIVTKLLAKPKNTYTPPINTTEETLPIHTHHTLVQFRHGILTAS